MNKYEWLAIHEAICFAVKNQKEFRIFIKRNKPYKRRKLISSVGFEKLSGAKLIGTVYSYIGNPILNRYLRKAGLLK